MSTKQEIINELSEEQRDIVLNCRGRINLNGCAGSGKTKVLVSTIAYMIEDGIDPSKILVFVFNNKAALRLREQIQQKIGPLAYRVTICTYLSFCNRILREYISCIGRKPNFTVYDTNDKNRLIRMILESMRDEKISHIPYQEVTREYISKYKRDNISSLEAKSIYTDDKKYEFQCIEPYRRYENILKQFNACDYDDLYYYASQLLKNNHDVLHETALDFQYIMADDIQDCNKQSLDILLLLGKHVDNLLLAGDINQSICMFKGSDTQYLLKRLQNEGFITKKLHQNFRNSQIIVNAANSIIKNNYSYFPSEMISMNRIGELIEFVNLPNPGYYGNFIGKKIKTMIRDNPNLKYRDICVLSRTNDAINSLEDSFCLARVPFINKSSEPLYLKNEIKDILAFLKFSFNDYDLLSFGRLLSISNVDISDSMLYSILKEYSTNGISKAMGSIDVLKRLQFYPDEIKMVNKLLEFIDRIRINIRNNMSPEMLIDFIVKNSNYNKYLKKNTQNNEILKEKENNIDLLLRLARSFNTVSDMLYYSNYNEDRLDEEIDAVNLMTIHSSKGLEFPIVFFVNFNDCNIPSNNNPNFVNQIEEERRLLYVALTRAKCKIFLLSTRIIYAKYGMPVSARVSRFFNEIPSNLISIFK